VAGVGQVTVRRVLVLSLATATVIAGLQACSSNTGGTALPDSGVRAPSGNSVVPSTSATPAAPKVSKPLDASPFVARPCSSLTTSDVVGVGLTDPISSGGPESSGAGCTWAGETGGIASVDWVTANKNGLSDLYAKLSTFAYWQPTMVAGYPAVYGDALRDLRSQGNCVLNVGVNDHLTFFIQYDDPLNAEHSCSLAGQAAADVIANLKGAA
jgi:hypothetical protein